MKIAILTSGILPIPAVQGGAVENLVDFLLEYNEAHQLHDITVYSVWHPDVEQHQALQAKANHYIYIKVNTLWGRLMKKCYQLTHHNGYYHYSIEYFLHKAIRHIRRQHYDVILLENRPGYALKLKGKTNARLVYHLHNEKLTAESKCGKALYDAASLIITVSDYIKSRVLTINPQDTKTTTVYNGIELSAFSAHHPSPTLRKELGIAAGDFVMLFSGRVTEEKGILQLIEAMTLLKVHQHIKLLVIGSSFYGNATNEDHFIKKLKEKANALKERILFTGFVPYVRMPDYLRMADVAVIPSVWDDPFPTTVLEAQATGLPIITTRRGGIPEEITDKNAILLNTDRHFTENLAFAILNLYEHPEKRKQMSEAALEHSRYYNKERYAQDFFKTIGSLNSCVQQDTLINN